MVIVRPKVELKCFIMEHGDQYVMILGIFKMLMWYVKCWVMSELLMHLVGLPLEIHQLKAM